MDASIIEAYVEKVYGYATNHTYSRDEADELSQEILFTAIKQLPKLKDESKLEPWLWSIASNVTKSFRRFMGKRRAMYSYDTLDNMLYEDEYFDDTEEIYDSLRTKIAMLSSIYRDIIILYYYDGLSTKRIAEKLNIPEGTVTWRLSEARKKIKKECDDMNESALRPIKMQIGIYGSGDYDGNKIPFPETYINDALSQNILYYCYEKPLSIEDLAKLCGVPAYFVEERISNLLKRDAVVEASKGKYQTSFIIYSDKHGIFCEENSEKVLLPIADKLVDAIKNIAKEAKEIPFYKAEKTEGELLYLYGVLAFSYASEKYCKLPFPDFDTKYDGNRWNYIGYMESGNYQRTGIGVQKSANLGSRGVYSHTCYNMRQLNTKYRKMMYDYYINVCEDILANGKTDDKDSLSNAIKEGYIIRKNDGSFFVTVPAFDLEQIKAFSDIADKYLSPLMNEYSAIVDGFIADYKKLFPKHLSNDIARFCNTFFAGLYPSLMVYAQKNNLIPKISNNFICDVLIQEK